MRDRAIGRVDDKNSGCNSRRVANAKLVNVNSNGKRFQCIYSIGQIELWASLHCNKRGQFASF
jgi:hypothetical protein